MDCCCTSVLGSMPLFVKVIIFYGFDTTASLCRIQWTFWKLLWWPFICLVFFFFWYFWIFVDWKIQSLPMVPAWWNKILDWLNLLRLWSTVRMDGYNRNNCVFVLIDYCVLTKDEWQVHFKIKMLIFHVKSGRVLCLAVRISPIFRELILAQAILWCWGNKPL